MLLYGLVIEMAERIIIDSDDALVIHKRVGASGQISVGTEYAGRLVTAYIVLKKEARIERNYKGGRVS